jgi:outer membrane lipoprotein-sorting protein
MAVIFVLSLAAVSSAQMTGDEIIQKHLEKTGGLDNYKNLQSEKMEGKAFIGQMPGDLVLSREMPAKYNMSWKSDQFSVTVASDGKQIWQQIPMVEGYIFSEGEDLPKQLEGMLMNPYLDYKDRGASAKYIGDEKVKGIDTYKVEYIQATGDTAYLYFDKSNFNILRQQSSEGDMLFEKFKPVDGFTIPHQMTTSQGGQRIMMIITNVEINPELPDSIFEAPPDSLRAPQEVVDQLKAQQEAAMKQQEQQQEQQEQQQPEKEQSENTGE